MPRASLLGIPPELRLRIYKGLFSHESNNFESYYATGSLCDIPGQRSKYNLRDGPWPLLSTCRIIERELEDYLPSIESSLFSLEYLTRPEIEDWLRMMGKDRVGRLRNLELISYAPCASTRFGLLHEVRPGDSLGSHIMRCTRRLCATYDRDIDGLGE